jgi:cyclic pyranopterin phosphate synthase
MKLTNDTPLVDTFARRVNYLRISVTDRCNLRCRYCAPSMPPPLDRDELLSLDEISRLVRIGVGLGINKVRLTGGEPLCRRGLAGFIQQLRRFAAIEDISLTTNGTMLADQAGELKNAGLRRINISLDTLDRDKFARLTGADRFDNVWDGIMTAAQMGFNPLKINTVVMNGFNDDEIEKLADLSMRYPFHIRFIEYMPIGTDPHTAERYFLSIADMRDRLKRLGPLIPIASTRLDGPAQRYRFEGAPGEVGLIGSMSSHFCGSCNRLRLTADGYLRPCLLANDQVDVKTPMRSGASDDVLASLFVRTIRQKKGEHRMSFSGDQKLRRKMVSIGG